jgi:uncharacterized protein YneF (UPF0154 family)
MKDGKSVFVVVALIVFIAYVLRGILGQVSALILVPADRLLFISHSISPVIMWALLGLLVGLIYGSFIAIKKYRLDFKLIAYPIVLLLMVMSLIVLGSFILKKTDKDTRTDRFGNEIETVPKSVGARNLTRFDEVLNKGISAVESEEYKTAEKYFRQAADIGQGDSRLDSLAKIYSKTGDQKCRLFKRDSKLKYIPNHYYTYAAVLTGKLNPEVCK